MKRSKNIVLFGFTLIELLVVISIIAILASLTLSMVDYAKNKAARDRATAEISALELALESYKVDNGDYPRDTNGTTDSIATVKEIAKDYVIPRGTTSTPPTISGSASMVMYTALSADANADRIVSSDERSNGRIYFSFKPGMLYPRNGIGTVTAIIDPFGNVYGYSTIGSGTNTTTGTMGYNPTFDLWSTVDPTNTGTTGTATWITNW